MKASNSSSRSYSFCLNLPTKKSNSDNSSFSCSSLLIESFLLLDTLCWVCLANKKLSWFYKIWLFSETILSLAPCVFDFKAIRRLTKFSVSSLQICLSVYQTWYSPLHLGRKQYLKAFRFHRSEFGQPMLFLDAFYSFCRVHVSIFACGTCYVFYDDLSCTMLLKWQCFCIYLSSRHVG